MIDFRSDTVTKPTVDMLECMQAAKVGDDVFGDDPTVNELETVAADLFGKPAALFCPSGTMTNQIAIKVHTNPGEEVICDRLSHIYNYEGGGIASNSGCSVRLINGDLGRFDSQAVLDNINPDDPHFPRSALVCIENTCNKGGGSIWENDRIKEVSQTCRQNNLPIHLDGARIFNAIVASNYDSRDIGACFDSISICLSKGLGCPVGSLTIGNEAFIKEARRVRKRLGGGMRQAGYLAAAGLFALKNNIHRLQADHENARALAVILKRQNWVSSVMSVDTNIVVAKLVNPEKQNEIIAELAKRGLLCVGFGKGQIRFVTHLEILESHIDQSEELFKSIKL